MTYELLKIFYAAWMVGVLALGLNAISNIIFAKKWGRREFWIILTFPFFLAVWPLALCSPNGRKILLIKFNQL